MTFFEARPPFDHEADRRTRRDDVRVMERAIEETPIGGDAPRAKACHAKGAAAQVDDVELDAELRAACRRRSISTTRWYSRRSSVSDKKTRPPRRDSVPAHRRKSTVKMPTVQRAEQRAAQRTPLDVKLQREIALLTERLGEMQRRLARKEEEHQGDADFIGKLLAEVADRDRKLKEARAASGDARRAERLEAELTELDASYAEVVVDLETAQDRLRAAQDETKRLRLELEGERSARTAAERALEMLHASLQRAHAELAARGAPKDSLRALVVAKKLPDTAARARTDLGWLLEVLHTVKDETRIAANRAQSMLDGARKAFDRMRRQDDPLRAAADAHAAIVATMRHATAVQDGLDALDAASARATQSAAVATDDETDAHAVHRARKVVMHLWQLRDALAPLVPPDVDDDGNELTPLPPPAPRRMRSRMPPAR
jgi:hypothetical protein